MNSWIILPPVAFLIVLAVSFVSGFFGSTIALKGGSMPAGKGKAYACGEDVKNHRVQPNYEEFFPFAFFFTIMHVVALIVATMPSGRFDLSILAVLYVVVAMLGLFILFRKRDNSH